MINSEKDRGDNSSLLRQKLKKHEKNWNYIRPYHSYTGKGWDNTSKLD